MPLEGAACHSAWHEPSASSARIFRIFHIRNIQSLTRALWGADEERVSNVTCVQPAMGPGSRLLGAISELWAAPWALRAESRVRAGYLVSQRSLLPQCSPQSQLLHGQG